MPRFLFARLLYSPLNFLRFYHRLQKKLRNQKTISRSIVGRCRWFKRLLLLVSITSLTGLSLVMLKPSVQAQQPVTVAPPLVVMPPLPSEPPVYYPGSALSPQDYQPIQFEDEMAQVPDAVSLESDPDRSAGSRESNRASRAPATPLSQYLLEFNRSPIVGNRLRLQGVYPETRLGFTRPRNWETQGAKIVLRYQHSPALLAEKSRLMVRVNDTSVGSIQLDRPNAQMGEAVFTVPKRLIQDYNEITMLAEHQTAETCSNPSDPTLWTEILPDSRVVIDYRPQPIQLDFSSYPFPFLDKLSLEPNQLTYLKPKAYSSEWLTATTRFHTAAARYADYRNLRSQLVKDTTALQRDDRLIVIGTPAEQPVLSELDLPFPLKNSQFLDGKRNPVPDEVGLLMLTTVKDKGTPVLVVTGNSPAGVQRAVQMLSQSHDQQLASGQAITVDQVTEVPSPDPRRWSGYLPIEDQFLLRDLDLENRQPFQDVTVRGTNAPIINIPFRALPDDRFLRGSQVILRYSHSDQVNPRTSAVEVKIDGVTIGSKQLNGRNNSNQTLRLNIPEHLVKPNSLLSVSFVMHPRQPSLCGLEADQQLWGTLQGDTSFKLVRDISVNLPNLQLLRAGYPLTAPQDLSATVIALPAAPTDIEVQTLLALSERLGRISRAESVKATVYLGIVPAEAQSQNIVGIGTRERFPVAEVFQDQGFNLSDLFSRVWGASRVYALPDQQGVLKATLSPWNRERILLALTAQTEAGLQEVQTLLRQDALFSQIQGDTVLVSRNQPNPSPYDASGYNLEFIQDAPTIRIQRNSPFNQMILFLQDHWFFLLAGILLLALLLYGLSQLFLDRVTDSDTP
ncbi:MAG: cellulose biosynthesis cyclic di-GMP-binding regulatory protein BcsB [Elainella sp. Prado103]|jgi:hypothetical protein|nr:cellulose biosynthesis cyclic di-GMP-binding regulatory protein BcsB [Elainella sp. Prado103]